MCVNIFPVLKLCFTKTVFPSLQSRHISASVKLFYQTYRSPYKYRKWRQVDINEDEKKETTDEELDELLERSLQLPYSGYQVFVIQPYIKWGVEKKKNTTPQLQLLEAVTLIKTLREWKVVDEEIVPLQRIHSKIIFGKGNLKSLKDRVFKNPQITALFISLNTLTVHQQMELEEIFKVPVFDRYSIIMHIFKEHARTKEAKLQLQLAQLPYLWTILTGFNYGLHEKLGVHQTLLGGSGPKLLSDRRELYRLKEAKLKKEISELRNQRAEMRKKRAKQEIPVVAVIGYTNAGKTSLIKALTGKETLEPQDYLFATLDVTCHLGQLPSGLKAYFIDTLGFINDIPTYLIESFLATLEDAALAHVIVHVRDISHPDTIAQNDKVIEVLNMLNIEETKMENVITVGNKIDLVDKTTLKNYQDLICVSATVMTGIDVLRQEIEKKILLSSDKTKMIIRVETGSSEYNWLHEKAIVVNETPDCKNNQFMFVETIISYSCLAKFKHKFIKNYKS